MTGRTLAFAALLLSGTAAAEPAVVASGSYPEGLLWHGGRMYFTEMGADQVTLIENGATRPFWRDPGCGPTSIAPFGPAGFLINCHLGKMVVEVSASGVTGRRFRSAAAGAPIQDPNASVGDGEGGVFFSDSGIFSLQAPATGAVYHVSAMGVMTAVVGQIRYANGVNFDPASRTLYVSEHLGRAIRLPPGGCSPTSPNIRRPANTPIGWRGPTASRSIPAMSRLPNTAKAACICSTATGAI
jgi:sugar lactone lactonase YvrE